MYLSHMLSSLIGKVIWLFATFRLIKCCPKIIRHLYERNSDHTFGKKTIAKKKLNSLLGSVITPGVLGSTSSLFA